MDPVPALGEHSAAILAELGYEAGQVAELKSAGVI
jgi:itaconate CoA-transferase